MLNWRPVRGIELEIEQSKQRTKLIESDILRVRSDSEQIKKEAEQIEREVEQIVRETEQLRHENARLKQLNARERALSALIKQHCFAPECSSTLPKPTEPDCGPSSP
jgi:CMP-N-acetylneuraminic acid synthetase